MTNYSDFFQHISNRIPVMDQVLFRLSAYVIPLIVALVSLIAYIFWDIHYPYNVGQPLTIRAVPVKDTAQTAQQGWLLAEQQPKTTHLNTKLSETPFWIAFTTLAIAQNTATIVEFPSRHAINVSCWDTLTWHTLGDGSRRYSSGAISAIKAGFGLTLASAATPHNILCRMQFIGPARASIEQWSTEQLHISEQQFYRKSGLLKGGMLLLTAFVLVTALINRESLYILLAAWLTISLRIAAQSEGWDTEWLGHTVPLEWLFYIRKLSFAIDYLLTSSLFGALFREQLIKTGGLGGLRLAQLPCLPLLILAIVLPYQFFLPVLWSATIAASMLYVFLIIRILILARTTAAIWYSASICITLFSWCAAIISAALDIKNIAGPVNLITAALSSSLVAALAIAEKMRQDHKERLEAQTELVHTFDVMPIGLFTLNTEGQFLSANPALIAMLGHDVRLSDNTDWDHYFDKDTWEQVHNMARAHANSDLILQSKTTSDEASTRYYLLKAALSCDKIEGSLQDITEKYKAIEHLRFLANNDSLTKVLNRRGIETKLKNELNRLTPNQTLGLAYLDLDRFKLINDLFSHTAGDEVLKQLCERIIVLLDNTQQFGRIGGDEFIIVLPDTSVTVATQICRNIVDKVSATSFLVGEKAFQVRCSVGLVEIEAGTHIKDAISTADRACREAKKGHHDNLVIYEKHSSAFHEHQAELELVEQLADNSATNNMFLVMQPIMSLSAPHGSLNFEVLLRMRDHDGSTIPACRIITAGEISGQMGMIDRWVLSSALAWLNTHYAQLSDTQFVCMNLSGASLNDEKFIEDAFAILEKNSHTAKRLCIEITEGVALHDLQNTCRFINKVRHFGARIALDDFGAGYTSFSYLKNLPADLIKIDGSLIVDMTKHPANVAIVEAIVTLAKNLGMKVIAEWAEDVATVELLTEIGVDYVQGYIVAQPQYPDDLLKAASSAGFIKNEQLTHFLSALNPDPNSTEQLELLNSVKTSTYMH